MNKWIVFLAFLPYISLVFIGFFKAMLQFLDCSYAKLNCLFACFIADMKFEQ